MTGPVIAARKTDILRAVARAEIGLMPATLDALCRRLRLPHATLSFPLRELLIDGLLYHVKTESGPDSPGYHLTRSGWAELALPIPFARIDCLPQIDKVLNPVNDLPDLDLDR